MQVEQAVVVGAAAPASATDGVAAAVPAEAASTGYLAAEQEAFYLLAFGRVPTLEEHQEYLREYGSVPTMAEVEAYVLASEAASEMPVDVGVEPRATWSHKFFEYGKWISRDSVWSLSLMPKYAMLDGTVWQQAAKQYWCHAGYGMIKTPWNLEPHKKPANVSSVTCN